MRRSKRASSRKGSARGSHIVTETSEVGSVEKDAGEGSFKRTSPRLARTVPAKSGGDAEAIDEIG
jgi:hypothetical protein